MSADLNQAFADILLGRGDQDLLAHLVDPGQARRLNVYRNNVTRAAIEALRAAYPAVNQITGANFFSPMARQYWLDHPPANASLTLYGRDFASHVAGYEPARTLPYLPAIAKLDRAWLEAHHATNAPVLSAAAIAQLPPDSLPALAPGVAASVRLLSLDFAVHAVWQANRQAAPAPQPRIDDGPQQVLVWRHQGVVQSTALSPGHFAFLDRIQHGASLQTAVEAATTIDPAGIDPAQFFSHGLGSGVFAAGR